MYADVIVDISYEKVDKPFSYRVPEDLQSRISIGSVVRIPFGNGNRTRKGYVVGFRDSVDYDENKIKDIADIDDKDVPIESQLIELAVWMKKRYGGTLSQSFSCVLPVKRRVKRRPASEKDISDGEDEAALAEEASSIELPELNPEQEDVLSQFGNDIEADLWQEYLLYGVTGSGKTRVYIEMMRRVIEKGRSVIVLIPEIALTAQNIHRFTRVFGDSVAVMHSRLSHGQRYEVYEKAKSGEIRVVLGPRSALFAPFSDLGLIIIDEEHETSYRSEQVPKYHAAEVARKRAKDSNSALVLGTATPCIDTMRRAKSGQSKLLRLSHRIDNKPIPKPVIIDMRSELKAGNRSMFSQKLLESMTEHLAEGNQIILFLNRRGVNGFVSCRSCGHVIKCPHCDVSLHQHRDGRLRCHYCGYSIPFPENCPECGSKYIGGFKAGTQSVETALSKVFPKAKVLRMDADTTAKKGDHDRILKAFADRKADILLGTQMIVKGHDFPGVTLVGILAADLSLNSGDYTSGERTFDLLVQAAGRAGRGERPGEVIIQTYQPENYAVIAAAEGDYNNFYERELGYRSLMHYPPVGHILLIQISDEKEEAAVKSAAQVAEVIKNSHIKALMAGPNEAVISKLKDRYRQAVYVKSEDISRLIAIKDIVEEHVLEADFARGSRIQFDFDPVGIY